MAPIAIEGYAEICTRPTPEIMLVLEGQAATKAIQAWVAHAATRGHGVIWS